MNKIIGAFGQVFIHGGKSYVYLVQIDEILYAALIIDHSDGRRLIELHDMRARKSTPTAQKALDSRLYRVVLLTTNEFKDRYAYLYKPDLPANDINPETIGDLNKEDKEALRNEIITGTYQGDLKREVQKMEIV